MIQRLSFWIIMIICSTMVYGQEHDGDYTNPILSSGADPWVIKHEGWYYYCSGVPGEVIRAQGAYIHNLAPFWKHYWKKGEDDKLGWRLDYNMFVLYGSRS